MKRLYLSLSLLLAVSGIAIYNQATAGSISGVIPHRHTANYNGGKIEFANLSGVLTPSKISPQGSGSGLNADKLDNLHATQIGEGIPYFNGNSQLTYNILEMYMPTAGFSIIRSNSATSFQVINGNNQGLIIYPDKLTLQHSKIELGNHTQIFGNLSTTGNAKFAGKLDSKYLSGTIANARFGNISSQKLTPQGSGSGLNADAVDSISSETLLSRTNHTGTQSPATISPQGAGSGLNADMIDSLDSTYLLTRSNHTGTQGPASISPQGAGSGLNADMVDNIHAGGFLKIRGGACQAFVDVPAGASQTGTEQAFTTYNTDIFTTNVFPYNNNLNVSICTTFLTNTGEYVVMTDGKGGALPTCAVPTTYNRAVSVVKNNDTAPQGIRYCLYASYY